MEIALRELLIDKGVFTADEVRKQVEDMDNRSPAQGARVVAKAWVDPEVSEIAASGRRRGMRRRRPRSRPLQAGGGRDTPDTHNVIVCTLCSCYPRWLLGLPPDWYKSRAYRSRLGSRAANRSARVRNRDTRRCRGAGA